MILYVNGDSNSNGSEIKNPSLSWPNLVSKRLNLEIINQSKGGTSNPRILRLTQEFINQNIDAIQNYFIIIGWTSWEREEWLYQGKYYDVNASGLSSLPSALEIKYKDWVITQDEVMRKNKSLILHEEIFKLHNTLCKLKVKHLFFNALMPFLHTTSDATNLEWNNNYLGPYENDLSYYWYLNQAGYIPTKNNHHLEDAQNEWANVLINYIETNNLL